MIRGSGSWWVGFFSGGNRNIEGRRWYLDVRFFLQPPWVYRIGDRFRHRLGSLDPRAAGLRSWFLNGLTSIQRTNDFLNEITPSRVVVRTGRFVKDSNQIRVQDIRSINVTKHGIGGVIGIGTIEISSAATDDAEVTFIGIAGADGVRDMVRKLQSAGAAPASQ